MRMTPKCGKIKQHQNLEGAGERRVDGLEHVEEVNQRSDVMELQEVQALCGARMLSQEAVRFQSEPGQSVLQ